MTQNRFGRIYHSGYYCFCSALLLLLSVGDALSATHPNQPTTSPVLTPPNLVVAIDDNYPPFIMRDAAGELSGYLVDIWKLWEQKTGVAVDLLASDWSSAQQNMQSHQATVIDTMFQTPARERLYDFGPAYEQISVAIYTHNQIGGITKLTDLHGFLVGVKAGDACIESLQQAGVTNHRPYPSYEALIQGAINSEVRIFCLDTPPANYLLYKANADSLYNQAVALPSGEFHRAVHKGDTQTLVLLNRGFAAISAAEKQALRDKWMGTKLNLSRYAHYLNYILPSAALIAIALLLWGAILRRQVKLRTAELDAERARLRALLEAIPDMVWMKDQAGIYRFCNPSFEKLYQISEAAIVGKTDYDLVAREHADLYSHYDKEAILANQPTSNEIWYKFADDGRQVLFLTTKTPIHDKEGTLQGVLGIAHDITSRKQAEQALQESENKLQTILDSVEARIFIKDCNYRYQYANRSVRELFGKSMAEIVGQDDSIFFNLESAAILRRNDRRVIEQGERVAVDETNTDPLNQLTSTYHSIKLPLRDKDGNIYGLCGISTDITERKRTESALLIAAAAFETQQGMLITDANNRILRVNQSFVNMSGYSIEELIGQLPSLLSSGRHDSAFYTAMWESINNEGGWEGEIWDKRKNGESFPTWLSITAVKDHNGTVTHYVATHTDITERKEAEAQILNLAFYDSLTSLPNRRLLADRLHLALASSLRSGCEGALLFIDLDNFKTLNDTLGHDKGDLLLQQVALRISDCLREQDTVARLGGDEFVVMLEGLNANQTEAAKQIQSIAEKILSAINSPYNLQGVEYLSSSSIGITLFAAGKNSSEELMKRADLAMYKAKAGGRNTLRFFDPSMQAEVSERVALLAELRSALALQQFELYYQPQIDDQEQITGAESLVRWQHPQRGIISPADFIPLAEDSGLILPLGTWVLETACRQLAQWASDLVSSELTLAVNISATQLHQANFVEQVIEILKLTGANPCRLKLELTESLLLDDIEDCIDKMERLRILGVRFALDDFGTGYSSLAYLKRLPLEQLKIDQSFTRDVLTDANDAAIARTIVALAHSLGLSVIAEGVETTAQRSFLADNDCHAYQGYLFSRPVPIAAFNSLLLDGLSRHQTS